jgi:hypothetical protein
VAWNGSVWVATGPVAAAYSYDGITWTGVAVPCSYNVTGLAWNGSFWLAGGGVYNSNYTSPIVSSSDGITWNRVPGVITLVDGINTVGGYGIAWNGSLWVAVGQAGNVNNTIITSTDGITWTGRGTTVFSTYGYGVAWNGSVWVAVGTGGFTVATSSDGITWTGLAPSLLFSTQGMGIASRRVLPYTGAPTFPDRYVRGTITAGGTGSVLTTYTDIKPYSIVSISRNSTTAVNARPAFVSSIQGGTGFTITNTVPDTSTYNYIVM